MAIASQVVKGAAKAAKKKALDMSKPARVQRAKDMGFDVDQTLYRGLTKPFSDTEASNITWVTKSPEYASKYTDASGNVLGLSEGGNVLPLQVSVKNPFDFGFRTTFTDVKKKDMLERVQDGVVRQWELGKLSDDKAKSLFKEIGEKIDDDTGEFKKVFEWWNKDKDIKNYLKEAGFDAIKAKEDIAEKAETLGVFDPKNIRSVNAAFDPAEKESSNLLAQVAPAAVGVGAAATMTDEAQAQEPKRMKLSDLMQQPGPGTATEQQPEQESAPSPRMQRAQQGREPQRMKLSDLMPQDTAAPSPRMERGRQLRNENEAQINALREQASQTGVPLARDLQEIGMAEEMNALNMPAFKASAGSLFTFDDAEVGDILQKQLGAEIVQDVEGNYIAKLPSGDYAINKPGVSGQDVAKFGASVAAYSPAARLATVGRQALGGAATAAAIEGGQAAAGGTFNPEDVIIEAAAPVVMSKAGEAIKAGVNKVKGRNKAAERYLDLTLQPAYRDVPQSQNMLENAQLEPMEQTIKSPEFWARVNQPVRENAKRADIRRAMKENSVESVGWRVDKNGNVVSDPVQRQLVRKGANDQAVVALRDMKPENKSAALEMLDLAEKSVKKVPGSQRMRPNAVIGKNAMARFNYLKKQKDKASKAIGQAVRNDLKGKPVATPEIYDNFLDTLADDFDVIVDGNKLNFEGSLIDGSNVAAVRRVFNLLKPEYSDAEKLHKVKQAITKQIDYSGDTSQPPLDRQAEALLKSVRAQINDKLRAMSDDYAAANDTFSQAVKPMVEFQEIMGRRFDPLSERVDNFTGQELRKTITNYASANPMIEALDSLDTTARNMGGEFNDDIMELVTLNNEMERLLGSFAPGSLRGIMQTSGDAALDVATGSPLARWAVEAAKTQADRIKFQPPVKDKLELIEEMRTLINQ